MIRSALWKVLPRSSNRHFVGWRCISSSKLTIEPIQDEGRIQNRPDKQDLTFGTTFSSHMLTIAWDEETGWHVPKIVPYQDLSISPAASCLHYGMECFEGMKVSQVPLASAHSSVVISDQGIPKAYKAADNDNDLRLFRPDLNMKRLAASMDRLDLPGADFDHGELIKCLAELVRLDKDWIPSGEGYSLYLRPTVIATHRHLGVQRPDDILLFCITCPVGPYFKSGFEPIRLTSDTEYVRAWPGGTGSAKCGGNYAATMKAQSAAVKKGYSQVLWLFGDNDEITEVGAMNIFFFLVNKETGRKELVTAPLWRGDILAGVTRQSILDLARSWGEFDVSERFATMPEIQEAANEGRLLEAFGAGTAAVVVPVSCIQYKGVDIEIPSTGDLTKRCWDEILDIQYGRVDGPKGWSWKI